MTPTGNHSSILGLIPARGQSKGIPRKNLILLAGRPLLSYSVEAAVASQAFDRIVVSTDSEEIADTAKKLGAEVPFLRPEALAADHTPGIDPVVHAVHWLESEEGYRPQYVMMLQPTSPFRSAEDIQAAAKMLKEPEVESVVSVGPVRGHPLWMKRLTDDGKLIDYLSSEEIPPRRQDLPPVYVLNGAIYLNSRSSLLQRNSFFGEETYGYVMPAERSLDIDEPWDLQIAELLMRALPNGNSS